MSRGSRRGRVGDWLLLAAGVIFITGGALYRSAPVVAVGVAVLALTYLAGFGD